MSIASKTWFRTLAIRFVAVVTLWFGCHLSSCVAQLILTAPPRESLEAGQKVYEPLAKFLSTFFGEPVIYEHPKSWKIYEQKMKNDEYDIIFDGPHFAAWRIDTALAKPLVKLPGSLRFVLIVKKSDQQIKRPEDLFGKTICTLPAPNLGALTLFAMYPYPARQPKYRLIKGGFREISQAFITGQCDGAILRSSYYFNKTEPLFRDATKVIKRSAGLTNQGITISRRVKPEYYNKLVNTLVRGEGKLALKPILKRFYSKGDTFVPAKTQDYRDQNLLRDTGIFGW